MRFESCDMRGANDMTIRVMAAVVAENEAKAISQGTKDAFTAAKARGEKFGSARPGAHRLSPRRAVKTAHLRALENCTPVSGHFQNRTLGLMLGEEALPI